MSKKILFFIPNLSVGGAEKVLVNLVNNMDRSKFDITVQTLFAGGVNEQFLSSVIKKLSEETAIILSFFRPRGCTKNTYRNIMIL